MNELEDLRAAVARVEALADEWDAPLGDYQWFAQRILGGVV